MKAAPTRRQEAVIGPEDTPPLTGEPEPRDRRGAPGCRGEDHCFLTCPAPTRQRRDLGCWERDEGGT